MGCLFDIFIQIFIEGILNLVVFIYLKLAHMLVPNKKISEKNRNPSARYYNDCIRSFVFIDVGHIFLLKIIYSIIYYNAFNL